MKTIVYVSRVAAKTSGAIVPTGLYDIYKKSMAFNQTNGIFGTLYYRNGHYLQVIEGPDQVADQLFAKIQNDGRHEQLIVLINQPADSRSYKSWDVRLQSAPHKDAALKRILEKNLDTVREFSQLQKDCLSNFFTVSEKREVPEGLYTNKLVKISEWPDLSKLGVSNELIELCVLLTGQARKYEDLLEHNIYESKQRLDDILAEFLQQGILRLFEYDAETPAPTIRNFGARTSNTFYEKMRNFLRMPRHGV